MFTRKMSFVVTTAAVLAIASGGFNTATAQSGMSTAPSMAHTDARVWVENNNEHEVELYAITADGMETRLGLVRDRSSSSFTLPATLTSGSQNFQLRISCVWPTDSQLSPTITYHESVKTNPLTASPGEVINVHVREPLRDTFIDTGQS